MGRFALNAMGRFALNAMGCFALNAMGRFAAEPQVQNFEMQCRIASAILFFCVNWEKEVPPNETQRSHVYESLAPGFGNEERGVQHKWDFKIPQNVY